MLALYIVEKAIGGYARNLHKFLIYWCDGLVLTVDMAAFSDIIPNSPLIIRERIS